MIPNLTVDASQHEGGTANKLSGHKVVAMPPPEVLKKHRTVNTPTRSLTPGRSKQRGIPRPKSPARTPASRSRDIVQEVYDRMGVNYVRGRSSVEFDDNKSTISIHSGTKSVTKSPSRRRSAGSDFSAGSANGQPTGPSTEGAGSQSVSSRGRVGARWPPPHQSDDHLEGTTVSEKQQSVVVLPSNPGPSEGISDREDGSFPSFHKARYSFSNESRDDQDQRDDNTTDEGQGRDGHLSPVSVKSRISTFSGHGAAKSVTRARSMYGRNSFNSHFGPAPSSNSGHPRQIHVYPECKDVKFTGNQEERLQPPESLAATVTTVEDRNDRDANMSTISMDESHGLGQTSRYGDLSRPRPSFSLSFSGTFKSGMVGSSFAAASPSVKSTGTKRVPDEIRPSEFDSVDDDHSVAASSVSGEDFAGASKTETPGRKHRLGVRSVSSFVKRYDGRTANDASSKSCGLTLETIQMLIEERLDAKFEALTETLGGEIRRVEQNATARLDELEKKIEAMAKQGSTEAEKPTKTAEPGAKPSPVVKGGFYRSSSS